MEFQSESLRQSVATRHTTTGIDVKNMSSDENFICKVQSYNIKNALAQTISNDASRTEIIKMEDSLDVCNYRIVKNFMVNKIRAGQIASPKYEVFDASNLVWNTCFFNQTNESFQMDDTLDICNYRHDRVVDDMPTAEQTMLTYKSGLVEYSNNRECIQFTNSRKFKPIASDSKSSSTETNAYVLNQSPVRSKLNVNESIASMNDTMDVCCYRHSNMDHATARVSKPITPANWNRKYARYFGKTLHPIALFKATPVRSGPITSSPIVDVGNSREW